jgi:pimeloyl-ACP methyl ester carboxylesterase
MKAYEVHVAGVSLFVYEWGSPTGRPLLYWDGLGGTGLHANEIAPILVEEHGLRVIAPDAPGHGRSPALTPEAYRPSALASRAADLLSALGVARAAFVGFSWGAEVGCAFAARHPERTTRLVLIDGGYLDLVDLPDVDPDADLSSLVSAARQKAHEDRFPSWEAYFEAEEAALKRWTPALAEAHRATMREEGGWIVPILAPEAVGAIDHGNLCEPTISTQASLRSAAMPILLLTPTGGSRFGRIAEKGVARLAAGVPQLRIERIPGDVHDLVSYAAPEVASLVGNWLNDGAAQVGDPRG